MSYGGGGSESKPNRMKTLLQSAKKKDYLYFFSFFHTRLLT